MKVGIIGAMEIEIKTISEKIEKSIVKNYASIDFIAGSLNGNQIILAKCGIGKVNAAVATQAMIDFFDIDCVINIGVAGSLNNDIDICDIVISSDVVQHDFDTSAVGDPIGFVSGFKTVEFKADNMLIEECQKISNEIFDKTKTFVGRIATGDQFIQNDEQKNKIVKNFKPLCAEMEGGAIAQTCELNNIPFLIIRSISDKADHSATLNYEEFCKEAAENSSALVEKLCDVLKSK